MADQAELLRDIRRTLHNNILEQSQSTTTALGRIEKSAGARVISVCSGKGGVGKTNLVCSIAVGLAKLDKRVVVIDADLGLANVDLLMGLSPRYNLRHVVTGERTLQEVTVVGPSGIKLIPGASGIQAMADLASFRRSQFLESLEELETEYDFVLIDTSAGISSSVVDFVLAAEEIIAITTPEPTSVADVYAMIKVICNRGYGHRVKFIVNMAGSEKEAYATAEHLKQVVKQFLSTEMPCLGVILNDKHVPMAVRIQTPFVQRFPGSQAAIAVCNICKQLIDEENKQAGDKGEGYASIRSFFSRILDNRLFGTGSGSR